MMERERKLAMMTMMVMHTQVLLGLLLYFMSPMVRGMISAGKIMNETLSRFWVVEHLAGMILAAVLITIGYTRSKVQDRDWAKHRMIFAYYLLALLIILLTIPWPFREVGMGRGWF
ncbi:MAG: cytochrome B [Nitrospirota bacterium]|nr:cytochrome B [Nitrospirota bacterium]